MGRAKSSNGTGRIIPINDDLASILAAHRAWFLKEFGEPRAGSSPVSVGKARSLRSDASRYGHYVGLGRTKEGHRRPCRLHDLRHTFATRLAENGVSESTMLALMGHMSRAMLERYSHIRMTAKRDAVAGVVSKPAKGREFGGSPCESPCT